jgi:hypothetical protein
VSIFRRSAKPFIETSKPQASRLVDTVRQATIDKFPQIMSSIQAGLLSAAKKGEQHLVIYTRDKAVLAWLKAEGFALEEYGYTHTKVSW